MKACWQPVYIGGGLSRDVSNLNTITTQLSSLAYEMAYRQALIESYAIMAIFIITPIRKLHYVDS